MSSPDVLRLIMDHGVEFVDLRFLAPAGSPLGDPWRHVTLPAHHVTAEWLTRGHAIACAYERSSPTRLHLRPDPNTARLDPFAQHPTLMVCADVHEPETGHLRPDEPRGVLRRALQHAQQTGLSAPIACGADLEFHIFDQASFEQGVHAARVHLDSREAAWRRGRDEPDNLGLQVDYGAGADALPPADSLHNLRAEIVAILEALEVRTAGHRRAPGTAGHGVIVLAPTSLLELADALILTKYVIRNVAARHGKVATFMPNPLFGEPGNRLLLRLSAEDDALRFGADWREHDLGRWIVGGILHHLPSLLALARPSTNAYRGRPGRAFWVEDAFHGTGSAPAELGVGICDPTCQPHLALAALLQAALDGHRNTIEPPADPTGAAPAWLDEALGALASDHAYLLAADVFSAALVDQWLAARQAELAEVRRRPHPYEFTLYFNV